MSESARLSPVTTGFALAAAVSIVFNTALAWAKDAYPPLNTLMASIAGHHWTTHGLADLALFVVLGFVFSRSTIGKSLPADRRRIILIGATTIATLGLILWFVFV